jgi:hypothetical protein
LDYPKWLESVGFKVKEYDPKKHFDTSTIERYRLIPEEVLYVVTK